MRESNPSALSLTFRGAREKGTDLFVFTCIILLLIKVYKIFDILEYKIDP